MATKPVLFLILASAALSCGGDRAPAPPTTRAVRVAAAAPAPEAATRRYAGALEPREQVEISFRAAGRVEAIGRAGDRPLQEGDPVARGDVLAVLDAKDLRDQASAARAAAAGADADLRAAEAVHRQAEIEVERARRLVASGATSRADADRAEGGFGTAIGRLEAARSARAARQSQAAAARRALTDARLTSPIDGVIAQRLVDPGESVTPGRPAFVVIDDRALRLGFAVPDTRVAGLAIGDQVPVTIDAAPGRSYQGVVTRIDPVADPVLRTFRAQVTIDNADRTLHAGMIGAVGITPDAAAAGEAVRVPLAAVQPGSGSDDLAVWTIGDDGAVSRRTVRVTDVIGADALVTSGLAPGERVVTDGAAFVHEGEVVEVVP